MGTRGGLNMRRMLIIGPILALSLAACGSGEDAARLQALQEQADIQAIEQIEVNWHKAASTKDIDLVMSLFDPDATFTLGSTVLRGTDEIRDFFVNEAAPFQPQNNWVSETPAYKVRATVNGDKGTLYFECHYVDVETGKVVAVVGAEEDVARIEGRWVITRLIGSTPTLAP
jgi:uncharacterized protein (TIGR02246 family)